MNVMKSVSLMWLPLSLALVATGCKQDTPEPEAAAPEVTEEAAAPATVEAPKAASPADPAQPLPGTDAVIVENHSSPTIAAPGFDAKSFVGRYGSGQTTLDVALDGKYTFTSNGNAATGTWTAEANGKTVLLDPDTKGDQDSKVENITADSVSVDGTTLQRQ